MHLCFWNEHVKKRFYLLPDIFVLHLRITSSALMKWCVNEAHHFCSTDDRSYLQTFVCEIVWIKDFYKAVTNTQVPHQCTTQAWMSVMGYLNAGVALGFKIRGHGWPLMQPEIKKKLSKCRLWESLPAQEKDRVVNDPKIHQKFETLGGKSRNRRTFSKIENLRFLQNYDDYNFIFGIKSKGLTLPFILRVMQWN